LSLKSTILNSVLSAGRPKKPQLALAPDWNPISILKEQQFAEILAIAERDIAHASPAEVPKLFASLPLDVFALLLLDPPDSYPNLRAFLPRMPSAELQENWVGASGIRLLGRSVAFVRSVIAAYDRFADKPLVDSKVLDYGCGWGRLMRLFYKDVPTTQLYGVDAWPDILATARELGMRGNLAAIDEYPERLPFEARFELIFAFSVFTHLSQKAQRRALKVLADAITDDGLLVLTILAREFWLVSGHRDAEKLINEHDRVGFAFCPQNRKATDGDIPFGDTSLSIRYTKSDWTQWSLLDIDYNLADPMQVILFLRKRLAQKTP